MSGASPASNTSVNSNRSRTHSAPNESAVLLKLGEAYYMNGDYNDAHTYLNTAESNSSSNLTGYLSERFDDLMASAARQTDPLQRRFYLQEAEKEMLGDHPVIPIYFYVNKSMVSPAVSGWGDNVLNYHYSQHLSLAADE